MNLFHKAPGKSVADIDEIPFPSVRRRMRRRTTLVSNPGIRNTGMSIGDTIDAMDKSVSDIYGANQLAEPWYSDQILPFDVTLAGANEYGAMAAAKIFGIEILNEGSGVSIDDAGLRDAPRVQSRQTALTQTVSGARLQRSSTQK